MVDVTLALDEKTARTFLADVVPDAILGKTTDKELVIDFIEKKADAKARSYAVVDGKKKIIAHKKGIMITSKHLDIYLNEDDVKKLKKLL